MTAKAKKSGGAWLKIAGVTVALGAIAGAGLFAVGGERGGTAAPVPESEKRPVTMVQMTPAREMDFIESIVSDGSVKARFYALVSPRVKGVIDNVYVREGDRVERDKTKLFQIESEKLTQSVDLAKQSLIIAQSALVESKANRVKAQADVAQTEKDFARSKSLYEQKVIPLSEYETSETKLTQLNAQEDVAETAVTLAEQKVTLAEISLTMAEKDLKDSVMFAPIDGTVSGRFSEPGEMGDTAKSIIRIDDTDHLKAVAYLPGQFYPRINPGASILHLSVLDREIGQFPITYKAPAIDSSLRTFEIWADVPGDQVYVVPGAQCVVKVVLKETKGVGVPRDAIQYRDKKYWIFVREGDAAKMLEVKPGMETGGWTQLLESPLKPGDKVVTQGQFLLDNGYPIRERGQ